MSSLKSAANLHISANASACAGDLCNFIIEKSNEAIKKNGFFRVGLSGGSLVKFLSEELPKKNIEWSKWKIFFCDERHVPEDHPECTFTLYDKSLFSKVGIPKENVFKNDSNLTVEQAAERYEKLIKEEFETDSPRFDMLLLGMGPDGHTCSLFPNHQLLNVKDKIVAFIKDSPKPPPERITLTMPILLNCDNAVFCSCGDGKKEMVKEVLENQNMDFPAARVQPVKGSLHWFMDKGAAGLLSNI
ncbi:DgyrCDS5463 [Dimorphilus gyrociliatus]|uniref:6-phosphogluconolactonase n=1 Tax=Dimorphilus gyrociliatus TaxID=2664684 RepID=A0A7I8VJY2_9ANNE|nr:DgyrCDS5463 [Dimorphilus gyrociliatus]